MSDPYYGGGGGGFSTQGGGSEPAAPKPKSSQTIRPITTKQFLNATQFNTDAEFVIDNVEVNQITLVGTVRNLAVSQTHVNIVIEDGTGSLEGRKWLDQNVEEDIESQIQQDTYIRVIGTIKSFANKRHLAITGFRPITDSNEIFYHLMEAQLVSLTMKRGKPEDQVQSLAGGGAALSGTRSGNVNDYQMGGTSAGNSALDLYKNLPQIQQRIMAVCIQDPPAEGHHIQVVGKKLEKQFDGDTILDAIEALINDGHLYTALDDEHVLPTA